MFLWWLLVFYKDPLKFQQVVSEPPKLKVLKLELGEYLLVHLVLISLTAHFGQFNMSYNTHKVNSRWAITLTRTNGPLMSLYLIVCKRKWGCRKTDLKVLIKKKEKLRVLCKKNKRKMNNLLATSVRSLNT